jgi:hypothetical protein
LQDASETRLSKPAFTASRSPAGILSGPRDALESRMGRSRRCGPGFRGDLRGYFGLSTMKWGLG